MYQEYRKDDNFSKNYNQHENNSFDTHSRNNEQYDRPWLTRCENRQPVPPDKSDIKPERDINFNADGDNKHNFQGQKHEFLIREKTESNNQKNLIKQEQQYEIEEEEEEKFFCGVCDHTSYSFEAFQEHVISQQHINRAARVFHLDVPTKKQIKDEGKDKEIHHCDICDVNCNGEICWMAHLQGAKHKKKEKIKLSEDEMAKAAIERGVPQGIHENKKSVVQAPSTLQEFMNFPEPLIGLEYVTEIQIPGEAAHFHCELCDAKFDNNLKFPHLIGVKHRLQVIKKRDNEWAKQIQASCEKRSELTQRLAQAARKLEKEEGRQMLKARSENVFSDTQNSDTLLPAQDPGLHWSNRAHLNNNNSSHKQSSSIPPLMSLMNCILPTPSDLRCERAEDLDKEYRARSYDRRDTDHRSVERRDGRKDKRSRDWSKERTSHKASSGEARESSCGQHNDRSRIGRDHSPHSQGHSPNSRGRSPHGRNQSSHSRGYSAQGRVSSPPCSRDRSAHSMDRSTHSRDHSIQRDQPSPVRDRPRQYKEQSKYRRDLSPAGSETRDISDEIRDEIKRQERRAEEKRRAAERKIRHEQREKEEHRQEMEERKKRGRPTENGNRTTPPPPAAPRLLDEDTKRLVMQNLTELAKCCVTNEADAELALQVSNALTQALLQYRMKHMPASVLQSIGAKQQQQLQQATTNRPPQPPGSPPKPPSAVNFHSMPVHQPRSQQIQVPRPELPNMNSQPLFPNDQHGDCYNRQAPESYQTLPSLMQQQQQYSTRQPAQTFQSQKQLDAFRYPQNNPVQRPLPRQQPQQLRPLLRDDIPLQEQIRGLIRQSIVEQRQQQQPGWH